jgi:hypothetical protein
MSSDAEDYTTESELESEDEAAELCTADIDDEIKGILNAIQSQDPTLYKEDAKFFNAEAPVETSSSKKRSKEEEALTLTEYHAKRLKTEASETGVGPGEIQLTRDDVRGIVSTIKQSAAEQLDEEEDDEDALLHKVPGKAGLDEAILPKVDTSASLNYIENYTRITPYVKSFFPVTGGIIGKDDVPLLSDDSDEEEKEDKLETEYNHRFESSDAIKLNALNSHGNLRNASQLRKKKKTRKRKSKTEKLVDKFRDVSSSLLLSVFHFYSHFLPRH